MENKNYSSNYTRSASPYGTPCLETHEMEQITDFSRSFEIRPGLNLNLVVIPFHVDTKITYRVHEAPINLSVQLSGETLSKIRGNGCRESLAIKPGTCSIAHIKHSSGEYRIFPTGPFLYIGLDIDPKLFATFLEMETGCVDPFFEKKSLKPDSENYFSNSRISRDLYTAGSKLLSCVDHSPVQRLYMEGKVLEMISLHIRLFHSGKKQSNWLKEKEREMINHAGQLLTADLENPPSIEELAILAGTNPFKLKKGFKQYFNQTVYGYLRSARMKKARHLMLDSGLSVTSAAIIVGYSNVSHFIAAYKREYSLTPGQQIKRHKKSLF